MIIKDIKEEDFVNYKKPSMFIAMGRCNYKCCVDAQVDNSVCQNHALHSEPDIQVDEHELVQRYVKNPITKAVVLGGLDPFEDFRSLLDFVYAFREQSNDDIVIYTGFEPFEINEKLDVLSNMNNIIIKFGRYIPNSEPVFDELLGVTLASNNQRATRIEDIKI